MRLAWLAFAHARIAVRQRALWVVPALLSLLSLSITMNTGMPYETGDASALAFYAQMLALLPPIAYAAACTGLASTPARLGIGEIEDSAPVSAVALTTARVAGAFAVVALPSLLLLALCGFGQLAHGNPQGPVQALALFAAVVAPATLLAMALSALAGAVLPRAFARIVGVLGWIAALALTAFVPQSVPGGGAQMHLAADPMLQAFFGAGPMLDTASSAASVGPVAAVASLAMKLLAAAALLATASLIARRRSFRRG